MVKTKSKLYDHCHVDTSIDTDKNTVSVHVSFKEHMVTEKTRVKYTAADVLLAITNNGVPAAEVVLGQSLVLSNRTREYLSGEYVFSMVAKKAVTPKPLVVPKETSNKKTNKVKVASKA